MGILGALILVFMNASPQSVGVLEGTVQNRALEVRKENALVTVESRTEVVKVLFPSGKAGLARVAMIYDPGSRLFWWKYQTVEGNQPPSQPLDLSKDETIVIKKGEIIGFSFFDNTLWVRVLSKSVSDLKEAQATVLQDIERDAAAIESGAMHWAQPVNLRPALGPDFLHLKGSASPFPMAVLRDVKRNGGSWELLFDGPNRDSAEVTLSENYRVLGVQHFPAK
jgi:hypothetical protein